MGLRHRALRTLLFAGFASLAFAAGRALAAGIVVIAHPGVSLAGDDVKEIYLGEKQFAGPVKLVPVDNAVAQDEFLRRAIGITAAKYGVAWTKKGFREGLNAPAVKGSDLEVIEFVRRTPGAIGYVTAPPSGNAFVVIRRY